MKLTYIKPLDGVRGVAALAVMFFHFSKYYPLAGSSLKTFLQKISIFGQTGVTLFFVLSGFLITRILLNTKESDGYFRFFYLKRTIRILPLYYLFLVIYYFIIPLLHILPFVPFAQQWYYWVYLQNFAMTFDWNNSGPNHYWSLAVEEHFYLFWPLLVYYLPLRKLRTSVYILIAFSFILRLLFVINKLGNDFYFTFTNLDALAIGGLLAIQEKQNGLDSFSGKKFFTVFLLLLVPTLFIWTFTGGKGLNFIQVVKFTLLSFIYYALIGLIISVRNMQIIKSLFQNKFMLYSGKISFGLYVFHPLLFFVFHKYVSIDLYLINFISCFVLSFAIASLSYYFFEAKFLTLKAKLH